MTAFRVECQDVLEAQCDFLVLKYAQGLYGADRAVVDALDLSILDYRDLSPGKYIRVPTQGRLPCKNVLLVGVPSLHDFAYAEIRQFAHAVMIILAGEACEKSSIAMTMHGVGYGLDEKEAFTAQVAGLMEYLQAPTTTWRPQTLAIIERNEGRAHRISQLLAAIRTGGTSDRPSPTPEATRPIPDAGAMSNTKKHVFVAMPYDEEMEDVYEFGIREPVNASGCLCERCDHSIFTGDVLDRIKKRITTATVVVADMTGANPNVYLEVGYAWGKEVPVLLVARKGEQLQFDVKTHKCIYYKNITDLKKQLLVLMPELAADDRGD